MVDGHLLKNETEIGKEHNALNKKIILIGLFLLLLLGTVGSAHAALVFSENFNDATQSGPILTQDPFSEKWGPTNYYLGSVGATGWTFGSSAYVAQDATYPSDKAILLNETAGWMSRSISLTPGSSYILTFDHWGDNRPTPPGVFGYAFTVSIGGTPVSTISRTYSKSGPGDTAIIPFTASGASVNLTLLFDEQSLGQASPIIDNINISSVPIPAAVWLLGTGLVGLIGIRRRFTS